MNDKKKFHFISFLRTLAICLVMWDHLGPFWADSVGINWIFATYIQKIINKPLAIIQDFGFFGVSLFFIVSGFIITYVAQRETRKEFIIKRFFRIFPPLILSTLIFGIVNLIIKLFLDKQTYWFQFELKQWILDGTLLNYFFNETSVINGVTWSLIIEIIFYIICYLTMPYIKKNPRLTLSITLVINITVTFIAYRYGIFHNMLISFSYLPILIFGQIIYFYWSKKLRLNYFIFFTLSNYILFILNIIKIFPQYYEEINSYGVSLVYAYMLFIICLLLDDKINNYFMAKKGKVITFISDISYSLYLNHMTFGTLILTILYQHLSYTLSFFLALVVVFIVSYLQFIYIEKPSISIMQNILKNNKDISANYKKSNESKNIAIILLVLYIVISLIVAIINME